MTPGRASGRPAVSLLPHRNRRPVADKVGVCMRPLCRLRPCPTDAGLHLITHSVCDASHSACLLHFLSLRCRTWMSRDDTRKQGATPITTKQHDAVTTKQLASVSGGPHYKHWWTREALKSNDLRSISPVSNPTAHPTPNAGMPSCHVIWPDF